MTLSESTLVEFNEHLFMIEPKTKIMTFKAAFKRFMELETIMFYASPLVEDMTFYGFREIGKEEYLFSN